LVWGAVFLAVLGTWPAAARDTHWNQQRASFKATVDKPITAAQLRMMTRMLVRQAVGRTFFTAEELPRKLTMAVFEYQGQLPVDIRTVTNMTLDAFLNHPKSLVVNQDVQPNAKVTDFRLMSYDGKTRARHRGMLMGANYLVTGRLTDVVVDVRGRPTRQIELSLVISDIRTDETILTEEVVKVKR
jgi:hypothetical protein